jgi:hypothetical protein
LYLLHTLTFPSLSSRLNSVLLSNIYLAPLNAFISTFVSWVTFYEGGLKSFASSDFFFLE